MNKKTKAFVFNFITFACIFFVIRLGLALLFPELQNLYAALISGALTLFLSPRFAAVPTDSGEEKLFVRWIFFKGVKEL